MFLSISTTHRPATDLGFLLMKHPGLVFEVELGFGKAIVFYPEASEGCAWIGWFAARVSDKVKSAINSTICKRRIHSSPHSS